MIPEFTDFGVDTLYRGHFVGKKPRLPCCTSDLDRRAVLRLLSRLPVATCVHPLEVQEVAFLYDRKPKAVFLT